MRHRPEHILRITAPLRGFAHRFAYVFLLAAALGILLLGRADPRSGETVIAKIVLREEAERPLLEKELRHFCRERLASYKVPEHIELVAALPRTASGKILHRAG